MYDGIFFINLDNHYLPLRKCHSRVFDVCEAIELGSRWGSLAEVRAYADMTQIPLGIRRQLQRNDVTPIDVPCRTLDGLPVKNAVDIAISLDIDEVLYTRPEIRRIVLGAGDGDYVFALARAQRYKRQVGVVAVAGALSAELRLVAGNAVAFLEGRPLTLAPVAGLRGVAARA